jgi:regulator of protease activity HflC (stomatin/prohibitin superfamily)
MQKLTFPQVVQKNQYALLFRQGEFTRILSPGKYYLLAFDATARILLCDWVDQPVLRHPLLSFWWQYEKVKLDPFVEYVETRPEEFALVMVHGRVADILPPGTQAAVWRDSKATLDIQPLAEVMPMPEGLRRKMLAASQSIQQKLAKHLFAVSVGKYQQGILYIDGVPEALLGVGEYRYWQFHQRYEVVLVETRIQNLEVSSQELLTKDKVMLRINLSANYQLTDPMAAHAAMVNPGTHLYQLLQFGLRAVVGGRRLEAILEEKLAIQDEVATYVRSRLPEHGLMLLDVGIKDIILPGEMRTLLAKVLEAEKTAEANIIARREETAATRSLINTAKVLAENPMAMRLKEMELLEKISGNIQNLSVVNGLESLLNAWPLLKKSD